MNDEENNTKMILLLKFLKKYVLYYCFVLDKLYLDTYDYENKVIIIKTNGSDKIIILLWS